MACVLIFLPSNYLANAVTGLSLSLSGPTSMSFCFLSVSLFLSCHPVIIVSDKLTSGDDFKRVLTEEKRTLGLVLFTEMILGLSVFSDSITVVFLTAALRCHSGHLIYFSSTVSKPCSIFLFSFFLPTDSSDFLR